MTTILVIEDDRIIRALIARLLRATDYDVLEASGGRAGIEQARLTLPDLIICDILMPEVDGYSVLKALREDLNTAAIPFIFLTAKDEPADIRAGMNLGADDYLTKPFSTKALLEAVKTRLTKHELLVKHATQKLDQLRRNITHALPHEFRTPLAIMLGYAQLMGDDHSQMDANLHEMLRAIRSSANRLYKLSEKFWTYAEAEALAADMPTLEKLRQQHTMQPATTIEEIARQHAQSFGRESDLTLGITNSPVCITQEHLSKIAVELIDNAFKFSKAQTPVYVLAFMDGDFFNLCVTDQGRGMTPEQIASIGAYMQFDRQQYEQQGPGLGLATVKRLVELYNGKLAIHSVPHRQTTVFINLPRYYPAGKMLAQQGTA
ncbi:MAG: response regulator [Chloroflexi bacterium]|nr:response regulator [Chloroflexota bacterium]